MNILEEIQNCPIEWKELGEVVDYEQPNILYQVKLILTVMKFLF